MAAHHHFEARIAGYQFEDPDGWAETPLKGIPKEAIAETWADLRWIATTEVSQKWLLRAVTVLARNRRHLGGSGGVVV